MRLVHCAKNSATRMKNKHKQMPHAFLSQNAFGTGANLISTGTYAKSKGLDPYGKGSLEEDSKQELTNEKEDDEVEEAEYEDVWVEEYEPEEDSSKVSTLPPSSPTSPKSNNKKGPKAESNTDIINSLLANDRYDWRVRPPGTNLSLPGNHGPVIVEVNMMIRSISKIDDVNMQYSVQLTFREEWIDGRLAYGLPNDGKPDFIVLPTGTRIWSPDSFIQNEKEGHKHDIDTPNVMLRVHKHGKILYSVRISLVLSCPMQLQYYPMDVQSCLIDLASYAYTDTDITYIWRIDNPIQLKAGLESSLPSFQLTNVSTEYCTSNTNTGVYSCLRTILTFRRQLSYYLLQLYIPCSMLVIVSWISFWLDKNAVPARVSIGITTLLSIVTMAADIPSEKNKNTLLKFKSPIVQQNSNQGSQHPHAYVDTTASLCIPNMVQDLNYRGPQSFQLCNERDDSDVWVKQNNNATPIPMPYQGQCENEVVMMLDGHSQRNRSTLGKVIVILKRFAPINWLARKLDISDPAKKADYLSRFSFPFMFCLFNIIYWTSYTKYEAQNLPTTVK
uniref:Ig-like domain-containing protein n=1 Tax=Rhabditophanes sp. KR3021 TaxID=114890 RepID=A0AC35U262_9BILA